MPTTRHPAPPHSVARRSVARHLDVRRTGVRHTAIRTRAVARTGGGSWSAPPFFLSLLLLSLLLLMALPAPAGPLAQQQGASATQEGQESGQAQEPGTARQPGTAQGDRAGEGAQEEGRQERAVERVAPLLSDVTDVEIELRGDVVVLSGTVVDRAVVRQLLRAAVGTRGVRAVINELQVEGTPPTEEEIGAGLQDAITELERHRVVEPGTIRLTPDPLPSDEPGDPAAEPGVVEPVEPATPEAFLEEDGPPQGLEELEMENEAICVFRQPAFAGSCVETPLLNAGESAAGACLEILRCLNDPVCPGVYCRATGIREGWALAYLVAPR